MSCLKVASCMLSVNSFGCWFDASLLCIISFVFFLFFFLRKCQSTYLIPCWLGTLQLFRLMRAVIWNVIGDPSALTHSYVQDMIVQKHKTIICFLIIVVVENSARLLGS
jgi:hypothetical protein